MPSRSTSRGRRSEKERVRGLIVRTLTVLVLDRQVSRHARSCVVFVRVRVEGRDNVPQARSGDPRVQPPVVPRLVLHPARHAPAGHVRGQGRVLRRRQDRVVLPELRTDPDPARRRQRERARARVGDRGVARGQGVRDLSRGHAHARRPAAPRPHRCRPARDALQRADRSGRPDRHRRRAADRLAAAEAVPPR